MAMPLAGRAAEFTAQNESLVVKYDDATRTFSLAAKAGGRAIITNAKLDGSDVKAATQDARDAIFGNGDAVVVTQADGSVVRLSLHQGLPFLLVTKEQKNNGAAEMDVQKTIPVTFNIDLGKPVADLKTMGTGGLLPVDKNPGSYLVLSVADPATRNGVVAGWLTQNRGSGTVFSAIKDGKVELKAQLEHGHLLVKPGQAAKLDTLALGYFPDARIGLECYADAVKRQYNIRLRAPLATYCSWYAEGPNHGGAGTPETTVELSRFVARELKPFGLGVIQLDDRWQDGPQIGGPATEFARVNPKGPYKDGITPVANAVAGDGLTFGLWWLPFGRNHMQPEYKDRQDWFFKWSDGKPLRQRSFGGTCLDSTNPAVRDHLRALAKTLRGWGVTYYKMDGLSAGAGVDHFYMNDGYKNDNFSHCLPPHDRGKTNIEAMRLGLATIREGAGDDVFFSGCCAVQNMRIYAGSIGLVDSMRVGPDFNHDGEGIRSGPLRGSRMYFLNGRIWWNDPDPSKVRTSNEGCNADPSINGAVTLDQARLTTSWVSLSGQFFLVSDWLPNLPQERLEVLRRTLTHHNATTRPVDYFDNTLANTWLVTDDKSAVRRDVIGVFNFYGTPLEVDHSCARLGLDPARKYHAFDFWANTLIAGIQGNFKTILPANSCQVIAVRAVEDHPVLLSTSRHVTQGIIDVTGEKWNGKSLSGSSAIIANDHYELRIAGTADGGKFWKAGAVTLSAADTAAGVTASIQESPGLLRVMIKSPVTRTVKWSVEFTPRPMPAAALSGLKATMADAESPVTLAWVGTAPFHDIIRDGVTIATGHHGPGYADTTAPAGKSVTYTVKITGGDIAATTSLTTKAFDPGPLPPQPQTHLGTLKPITVKVGYGAMATGKNINGGPLALSGKTYAHGIALHANAEAVYAKPADAKRFVAVVGLDDSQRKDPRASIRCLVIAVDNSGKKSELGKSPVLRSGKTEQWHFDLAIPADCVNLQLIVSDNGDGISCDHADWVDAGFL